MDQHSWQATMRQAREQMDITSLAATLTTPQTWQLFMQHHVFAVWDFMSLLKRLQRDLTGMSVPWTPAASGRAARLINEIVLDEETDSDGKGGFCSHFELYRRAMHEASASTQCIDDLVKAVQDGQRWQTAVRRINAPSGVAAFVETTLQLATQGATHEVAAAFLYGREALLPDLFRQLLEQAASREPKLKTLRGYFLRHVELDAHDHAPMAEQLLDALCADDPTCREQATQAALTSLQARQSFWRSIERAIMASCTTSA